MPGGAAGRWRCLLVRPASSRLDDRDTPTRADALVIDLGEAADPDAAAEGRRIRDALAGARASAPARPVFVRVPGPDAADLDARLDAIMPGAPDGILLGSCRSAADIGRLGAKLAVREAELGRGHGTTRIVAVAASTAASLLAMNRYDTCAPRLAALAWDARGLSLDLGLGPDPPLPLPAPLALARTLVVVAAAAAGVPAVDTASARSGAALRAECRRALRDGFAGKLARNPDQAAIIRAVFEAAPGGA